MTAEPRSVTTIFSEHDDGAGEGELYRDHAKHGRDAGRTARAVLAAALQMHQGTWVEIEVVRGMHNVIEEIAQAGW